MNRMILELLFVDTLFHKESTEREKGKTGSCKSSQQKEEKKGEKTYRRNPVKMLEW